ncbi:hypothetical protein LG293_17775 (plasmid) [Citricoccus nitrophenolicus]
MQDTFTRNELAWIFSTATARPTSPAVVAITRSLGLVSGDCDAMEAIATLTARGLAVNGRFTGGALILCQAAESTTLIRGIATFEEHENGETSHRTTVLSGSRGHLSLWEAPDGRFKLSAAGTQTIDPGVNLAAKVRNLAEEATIEGTFYRLATAPGGGTRLGVDTSFQFAEFDGLGWVWRPDNGDAEAPFQEARLEDILGAITSVEPNAYPSTESLTGVL